MDPDFVPSLAETRASSDTKVLKKAIQGFYALLAEDATGDKLQAAHANFEVGLGQLEQLLDKAKRIEQVTAWEVEGYRNEVVSLERLVAAQQERARRIEYDAIAKTITRLPDREKGKESQDKLVADIELLRQEERTYAETWRTRKLAFDAIVTSLEAMQEAIREEKAEQERRRALDEDDSEELADAAAPPPAAAATGEGQGAPLDPTAKPFVPGASEATTPAAAADGDVAMDGVEEEQRDREEGQVTDDREDGEMS
ncbi:hypothetical protein Rhopal_004364-T1 [Rhodotorula paludigena]|uniref:THO complex subunit 7 n=1 Tax=Rhodotorula paludigena TaxID=86838 RepID=A0AAV5GRM2_9BASI|nr:hypothetical protein Rhopal_004364-T1 [Rhodotorula paludigena]